MEKATSRIFGGSNRNCEARWAGGTPTPSFLQTNTLVRICLRLRLRRTAACPVRVSDGGGYLDSGKTTTPHLVVAIAADTGAFARGRGLLDSAKTKIKLLGR